MRKIILVLLAFTAVVGVMIFYKHIAQLQFMEEVSGINFPEHQLLENFDNGELFERARLKIDSNVLQDFIQKNPFKKLEAENSESKIKEIEIWFDSSANNSISRHSALYYIDSCTANKNNRISYIVDAKTGEFWGVVQYSDWSGHKPCE